MAIRIYAACLASYNNGRLHGAWIDCEGKDADAIRAEIATMLRASPYPNVMRKDWTCTDCDHVQTCDASREAPRCDECACDDMTAGDAYASAEEWAFHDHEGFHDLIGEYTDIETIAQIAEFLDEAEGDAVTGLLWLVRDRGVKLADALEQADDVRTFDGTAKEYAESLVDDCYSDALQGLPDLIKHNIDYDGIAQELRIGGDIDEFECPEQGRVIITNANDF